MTKRYLFLLLLAYLLFITISLPQKTQAGTVSWWDFQSIDTMKYSRDLSREKLSDPNFDQVIDAQIRDIQAVGATHVGIATPYDEEFIPILRRWVKAARKYNLKVWFRGNWSGWEKWFDYPGITRAEHIAKTKNFIVNNEDLFEDGDIFSPCPECENGGPGDPRLNQDVSGHRKFLIDVSYEAGLSFAQIGKNILTNYHSMNGDVGKLIMDKPTTNALGGIVVIDHYVRTSEKMRADIQQIAKQSGGKIILGEFGGPIPDINGQMTEEEQAAWLDEMMKSIVPLKELSGVNYWVNLGGSTKLWNDDGSPRKIVDTLKKYYQPLVITGEVVGDFGKPISNVTITTPNRVINSNAKFNVPIVMNSEKILFAASGYKSRELDAKNIINGSKIILEKVDKNVFESIFLYFFRAFNFASPLIH